MLLGVDTRERSNVHRRLALVQDLLVQRGVPVGAADVLIGAEHEPRLRDELGVGEHCALHFGQQCGLV